MSIIKVEVRTGVGMLLTLPLDDGSSGYLIRDILGLDPVKATMSSSKFANLDGARFQSIRRETRNIILQVRLKPNYAINQTVRQLRSELYSFFMTKTEVNLRFYMSDGLIVDIDGRVESCDAPMFVQEPRLDVSIISFDPDFLALDSVVIDDQETVDTLDEFTISYEGSVSTGILFQLNVDRALTEFTIYQRPPDNILRTFDFAADLEDNDILKINTVSGEKYITLTRTGVDSSLLYGKSPQSKWVELLPGDNHFRVYAVGDPIPFTITYTPRYGGL